MPTSNHNYYQQSGPRYPVPLFQQQQQQMPTQNNSPSMEEWMNFQQNMNATMHDLKMQIGQLANSVSQIQSARFEKLPSQTIPNLKGGNMSIVTLRSEINIPLLDAIKQVPKYAKFLKELCIHKRRKLKAGAKVGVTIGIQPALPRKCRDPGIFSIPCTIGDYTFADAMLDLGALINVMPTSVYKSLNFGDLEPTGVVIQLANKTVVQLVGILEDVLVQVSELIFPADFYVLDMEDGMPEKGSTLILGWPFFMTERMKIDVYARTL
ncbi:hypothetical protein CR513_46814, partial [Mucuna pruriens]